MVLHPDKPGKFRVCQGAAAQVIGHSLNKYLLSGPDIKNFFYMIQLNKKVTPALQYLWWKDSSMTEIIVLESIYSG